MATPIAIDTRTMTSAELLSREWLITNGLGGYASGTLGGDLARRYHGLFLPNLANPKGRHLMISRHSEEVIIGDRHFQFTLGESKLETGQHHLREFQLIGNTARWLYDVAGTLLERRLFMPHEQNTVCLRYSLLHGSALTLRLRPFLAFRRHDAALNTPAFGEFVISVEGDRYEASLKHSSLLLRMRLRPGPVTFTTQQFEREQILSREQSRGNECIESAYSPGHFDAQLSVGNALDFIASTQNWERLDFDVCTALDAETRRGESLVKADDDDLAAHLISAADQFLVLPANRIEESVLAAAEGHELRTVIAGYHWFGDWGRDTMISLEGLMLCTGRHREARATLKTFSNYIRDGLLPNLFPEGEREGLYHTADATLWYFHAIHRYVALTGDVELIQELLPVLKTIVEHHIRGTKFGIHLDGRDGLIAAGAEGYQLTWMDAKVGDWVVTPRRGKPVEIQALWYNTLCLMADWTRDDAHASSSYRSLADIARKSFNTKFWNELRNCLFDLIDGDTREQASVRPNQLFSISLEHPILDEGKWRAVIDTVERELLTPFGLRTLSRDHPDYKATYHGDLRSRDAAYHQGTVWPWLTGHFIDAWLKVHGDRAGAREMLSAFPDHLREAGIGTISEIFDAEEPQAPHGCIAQAWSVAEVLRAWKATEISSTKETQTRAPVSAA